MRYLITFACYGWHLHGSEAGSVDRHHNLPGNRMLGVDPQLESAERRSMNHAAYFLDTAKRSVVLATIRATCAHTGWNLLAAHVRTNHVHVIVETEVAPERVMNALKSYASRELTGLGTDEADCKRWARHGSTRWLWTDEDVQAATCYVVEGQGEPMAVHVGVD